MKLEWKRVPLSFLTTRGLRKGGAHRRRADGLDFDDGEIVRISNTTPKV